ncbi:PGBD-like protein [Dioscorea alata]|uniref:PGBD-like protein n=1 Tax=Dioscorea alata TaxID=55571 RepID=A0ACB7WS85_DIOAL|nr:PGBD-like protein [Dioscorea alata]
MASVLGLFAGIHRVPSKSSFPNLSGARRRNVNLRFLSPISAALSGSSWEREEERWLREEQRWLREERRWLREEARWNSEREALLKEIAALTIRIQALEHQRPRSMVEPAPRAVLVEETEVKELVLEEDVSVPQVEVKKKRALRRGSEGDDVREMQEALQRLGFYSGEEDMEYSSFSSGTERAVKTWQASVGTPEDGVMTTELLEMLFMGRKIGDAALKDDLVSNAKRDNKNGAPVVSTTEIAEVQQTVIKESGTAEIEVSQRRVFLIGENRWEEPSRLVGRDKPAAGSKPVSTKKCLSCRGEGRLMCIECDGTGEPNIEPQFLEWIDEGTKCPYCEGLGYTVCDVCGGKATVEA